VKFTDGYWQLRDDVQARYPAQVYDVTAEADALIVYAPTRKIEHRGDTLNEPLLTVRCTSPAPDVISVSVSHFLGAGPRLPQFRIDADPSTQVRIQVEESQAAITSGALTARFRRGEHWALEFLADDTVLTRSANKAMANFNEASAGFKTSLDQVDLTVKKYGKLADDADAFVTGDGLAQLSDLVGEARRLVANLTELTDQLNRTPTKPLFGDRRKGYEPK